MKIKEVFDEFFKKYKQDMGKQYLTYVQTSGDRPNDPNGSPHKIAGNAIDFTLRTNGQYSGMNEYHDLFEYMIDYWPYRAGIDNTPQNGNVHIHLDMGATKITPIPYFFIEDSGRFQKSISKKSDYKRG